ncbi:MAG: FAD-dependent oxidoreductase [Chloroflexi bacterium]|nr:FAD-dependent oxidoreductase [Chloroflexota bacterium]
MRVAIIGGGVSGCAAAWGLRTSGAEVVLFEAAAALGGRLATRVRDGCRFDQGAQYLKTDTPGAARAILEDLPRDGLADIGREVWTFDAAGIIAPGDPAQNAQPKWVYRSGLQTLCERLAAASGARIETASPVQALRRTATGWDVVAHDSVAAFTTVIITVPAAAAAGLVRRSSLHAGAAGAVTAALDAAAYRPIISVALGLAAAALPERPYYALVNADRRHAISWLAFEHDKPGYVPAGRAVIVAQMAAPWSAERMNLPGADVAAGAVREARRLLGQDIAPDWVEIERWREALPETLSGATGLAAAESHGLCFAGDHLTGGRVHLALESGLRAAAAPPLGASR